MPYDGDKRMIAATKRIEKISINPKNRQYIFDFIEQLSAEGITKKRQVKYMYILGKICRMYNKDFSKATRKDMVKLVSQINNSDRSEWSKHDYKVFLRRFMKWLRETEGQTFEKHEYPEEVKWISVNVKRSRKKLPKQLLNIDDVKKLAEHTDNLRDRCLVFCLYETGCRIGELLGVKIKDVDNDQYGTRLTVLGKTGSRKIRVIASAPAINNWLLDHPRRDDSEAFLFCGIWSKKRGEELDYQTIRVMLHKLGKKANIKKPINPHHWRHSRATELAKRLTEAQLCEYMGWVQGSQEASTYVHLSGRDTEDAILAMHGLKDLDKERTQLKSIECPRCLVKNDPAAKFCSQCSLGLDEKSIMDWDKQKEQAAKIGSLDIEMMKDEGFRPVSYTHLRAHET